MKKETKKAPTIRFRGFTDDWEQRKFGELFKRRMERNNGQFDKTKWISVAKMYYQIPSKVTSNNIDTRTYVLRFGDIAFEGHSNNEHKIGRFVENDIGNGIISELFPIYQHITPYDLNFWKYYINIENVMFPKLQRCIEVSYTSSNKLDEKFFLKEEILIPKLEEEKKIGTFFYILNNLTTLHQRKLDQLKTLKKYFLQNMFPTKGEKVPRIRFKGFTGDWEQRKLGDYVTIISGDAPSKFDEGNELYVKVDDLNCNSKYVIDSKNKVALHESINKAPEGSVVFPKRGAAIMTNKVRILADDCYIDTNLMALSSNKIDSEFLYNIISKEGLYKIADTSTIPQINNKHIEPYEVLLPRLDEQRTIGKFFKDVDNFITLHQRKLEQLQTMKKFMLQNLFI